MQISRCADMLMDVIAASNLQKDEGDSHSEFISEFVRKPHPNLTAVFSY